MGSISEKSIVTGKWGEIFSWEIHASSELPPVGLITAVACVALANDIDGGVVLTKNQRGGWEVLAGHIEQGESPEAAMHREAIEEGGYTISESVPIGYRKVTAAKKPPAESRAANYPYPVSYIAYFLAKTTSPIVAPTGEEIIESKTFSPTQLEELADSGQLSAIELTIIRLGLAIQ